MGVMKVPGQKQGAARQHSEGEPTRIVTLIVGSLRSRTEEKRRRLTFCDERDNNFVEITFFRQTSPFFKQIFFVKDQKI